MKRDDRSIEILLIEDNPGDALLVEEYITEFFANAVITHVPNFEEADDLLQNSRVFDTILLDLTLPDSEGISLIEDTLYLAETTPVVVLTGYTNLEFGTQSLSKGVSDYLLKDELSATLLYKSILYSIERNIFSGKLKESEKNYRDLFELSPQPMMLFDLETLEIIDVNQTAINHYGYTKKEFLSMTLHEIRPENDVSIFENIIQKIEEKEKMLELRDIRHKKKDGTIINVEIHSNSVQYKGKDARIVHINDVTEKLREEERLKLLESVITNTTESVIILEAEPTDLPNRKIIYVNNAFTESTGYSKDEVLGKPLNFLYGPKTELKKIEKVKKSMANWKICNVEFINYNKDGTPFWVNTSLVPVSDESGNYVHWVAMARDISKRKEYELQLKESLSEKEILLSEIHHRVKNNLAMISGLMQLQAFDEKNSEVMYKLYDSISRIQTMAAIHELLYRSDSFSRLQFSEIINKLLSNIHDGLAGQKDIEQSIEVTPIELNINQAVPCAIIINEVATNIYKHAFKERSKGHIDVHIDQTGNNISLSIEDNGVGLPENFNPESTETLGVHIIYLLADQLDAEYRFERLEAGTRFVLEFSKSDQKGAGSTLK